MYAIQHVSHPDAVDVQSTPELDRTHPVRVTFAAGESQFVVPMTLEAASKLRGGLNLALPNGYVAPEPKAEQKRLEGTQ